MLSRLRDAAETPALPQSDVLVQPLPYFYSVQSCSILSLWESKSPVHSAANAGPTPTRGVGVHSPSSYFYIAQSVHHICWDCSVPFQCSAINTSPTLTRGTGAYPLSPCLVVRSNHAICFRKQVQYWSHIPSFQGVLRQKYMYQQLPADYIMVCVLTFRLHPSY